MNQEMSGNGDAATALAAIEAAITGEVRSDRLTRAIFATDASIYEIAPDGVVFPRSTADVAATVRICAEHRVPVTARGAGTGLTGGAVNRGIQIDCSRDLNRILDIDDEARTARVEPGVVLDELNAAVRALGLQFAPDVATSSRATIGGMISNNSCGAHSVIYGRTVDHVLGVDVVLSDGSTCTFGAGGGSAGNPLAVQCQETLRDTVLELGDEIEKRYPKVMRCNGGYALDRLRVDDGFINTETIVCGSEGTLCVVVGATLKLIPLPAHKGLITVHFADLLSALAATPLILEHEPAAVELIDKHIIAATQVNAAMRKRRAFIEGDPEAILICELYGEDAASLQARLQSLSEALRAARCGYAAPIISDPARQADVWEVRKAGLGLLMSVPGDLQSYAFVEDTAVDPSRLRDYIERFDATLKEEGIEQAGYYAHASVGCIHARPVLNLKRGEDVQRMRRVADRISSLALEYGGTMTGEHGDGIVRSEWLEKMYGPRIMQALRRVKSAFDPQGILNPGKIVDPPPMTSHLRYGGEFASHAVATTLDFSTYGGMAGLAGMCSGVGQCRQRLVGTMCPSYMATNDEQHSTRARANALRLALSNRDLLDGLSDPALDDVLDLCLSCKACKTECPTGTDIAKLKAEWLSYRHRRQGVPRRARMVAASVNLAAWGSRFAPMSNWIMQSGPFRGFLERRYGLDRRVPPPRFARPTFRKWFRSRREAGRSAGAVQRPRVVYFVDTWTNYYVPQVGKAVVKVLEALGYEVIVPATVCCGRPMISQGLLPEASLLAEQNAQVLAPFAEQGIPVIGSEPSCVSALTDELPQFVRDDAARRVASVACHVESFVARILASEPERLQLNSGGTDRILYHGHCHQKALTGTGDAMHLLHACAQQGAEEINSGCCGMAGAFGHEVEHYEVARDVGEQRLFPAVRDRGDARVAISGFSCRHQISHHTGAPVMHVIEYLADAISSQ